LFSIEIGETYRTHVQTLFILKIFMQQLPEDHSKLKRDHLYSNNFFLPLYIFSVLTHQRTNPTAQNVFERVVFAYIGSSCDSPSPSSQAISCERERGETVYRAPGPVSQVIKGCEVVFGAARLQSRFEWKKTSELHKLFFS